MNRTALLRFLHGWGHPGRKAEFRNGSLFCFHDIRLYQLVNYEELGQVRLLFITDMPVGRRGANTGIQVSFMYVYVN